jgi:hypothetical protein
MATRQRGPIILRKAPLGFDECEKFQEGSGQSATKKGHLVKLSAGQIVKVTDASDDQVLGLLMQDASGTQGTYLKVLRLTPLHVLSLSTYAASANDSATAIGDIGKDIAIKTNVSGETSNTYADKDTENTGATATNIFMIIGVDPIFDVGDNFGRYLVCLKATNCQSWTA